MIAFKQISKTFNTGKANQVDALKKLDLAVDSGEFVVVVGANGSGKTTLLNLLAGTIFGDTGTITIDGHNVSRLPEYRRSEWIARIFQNPLSGTAAELSIVDNFRLAALRTKTKGFTIGKNDAFKNLVQDKIATLGMGLENKIEQPIGTLSGGQRQALTLLMSVMDECKILLLDEPTAALDPRSAEQVMRTADDLIKQYRLTSILVTHNLKDAASYGTRIIQMAGGEIIRDFSASDKLELRQADLFEWFG